MSQALLNSLTEQFKGIMNLENQSNKIVMLEGLIQETSSANLPECIKKRLIGKFAESQVSLVASLDFNADLED